jgi:hypothetical protein
MEPTGPSAILNNKAQVEVTIAGLIDSYAALFRDELLRMNEARKQLERVVETASNRLEDETKSLRAILAHEGYADKKLILRREPQLASGVELELVEMRKKVVDENQKREEDLKKREEDLRQREEVIARKEEDLKKRQLEPITLPASFGAPDPSETPRETVILTERDRSSSSSKREKSGHRKSSKKKSSSSRKESKKGKTHLKSSLTAWIGSSQSMSAIPDDKRTTRGLHSAQSELNTPQQRETVTLTPEEALVVRSIALEEDYLRKISKREITKLVKDAGSETSDLHPVVREALIEGSNGEDLKTLQTIVTEETRSSAKDASQISDYLHKAIEERKKLSAS